ncbi:annexin D5 [Olea europaea subsp. europaea]|uniref:Annexin D5 n=1 Tax=Olea europaea subsp. europaea TaxID=158383 RepID=A0A8S0PK81_OLEEU|nr:annexin D5 [Olea europaea subsp. europaea]
MATLSIPPVLTSPRDDPVKLHKAFKGFGCDTATVVHILAHRDATQRAFIEQEYRAMYSEELRERLPSELGSDVKAILLWMPDPTSRDAAIFRNALSGDKIDLKAATEVIRLQTPSQIQQFKQIYYAWFHAYLEHDIENQASGDHKKLLLACVSTIRHKGPEVDWVMAEFDAKSLYRARKKELGTDEKIFLRIFSERSRPQLAAISSAYHRKYGRSLKKVKSETSGRFKFALLTILRCAENPGKYFAKVLHKAMKGMGTDDTTLTRVIVTRAKIDRHYIKFEYEKKHGKYLIDAVHLETSSHYRIFPLSLLGAVHPK